jgi:hypothetical protein
MYSLFCLYVFPPVLPSARNYKEAGRLNEELKALLAKETDLAKDIDSLLSELEETSGKLDTVQEELAVTIEARSEAEKSEGGYITLSYVSGSPFNTSPFVSRIKQTPNSIGMLSED